MAYNYKKLSKPVDKDNAPGLKKRILLAPRSSFLVLAEPISPAVAPGDRLRITADHTFGIADGWIEVYTTLDTATFMAEMVGERDSRTTNPKIEFYHPNLRAEALEMFEAGKNDEWIALIQPTDEEDAYIQLGKDGLELDMMYSLEVGTTSSGRNAIKGTIDGYGKIFFYEGVITLKPEA